MWELQGNGKLTEIGWRNFACTHGFHLCQVPQPDNSGFPPLPGLEHKGLALLSQRVQSKPCKCFFSNPRVALGSMVRVIPGVVLIGPRSSPDWLNLSWAVSPKREGSGMEHSPP